MNEYVLRRVALLVPTLLIVTILVFSAVRLLPGDVVSLQLDGSDVTPQQREEVTSRLGLDRPILEQYLTWIASVLRGDLGSSLWTRKPVFREVLFERLPVTLELGGIAILLSILIGLPIGVLAAVRQDSWADYLARSLSIGGLSIPNFWLGTMMLVGLSVFIGWVPPIRYMSFFDDPLQNLQQLALPSLVLAINMAASVMRMSRTTLLEVLRQDYIRTAWAKGLRERLVLQRHALRNAMIPVVTVIGVNVAVVLSGSVIMEQIFGLPGAGRYMIESVLWRDYPAIQALNLFIAVPVLFVNMAIDIITGYLDPRIRHRAI